MNRFNVSRRILQAGFGLFVSMFVLGAAAPAYATSYVAPVSELDHFFVYSWELNKLTTANGGAINLATANASNVQVSLVFNDIRNYDSSANTLFVHMFDSSTNVTNSTTPFNGNVTSTRDEPNAASVSNIQDNMAPKNSSGTQLTANAASEYSGGTNWVSTSGYNVSSLFGTSSYAMNAGNTFLFQKNFTATAQDYTYNFNQAQIINFLDYISSANGGDIAIGLDSDCHYYFSDITLIVTQSSGGQGASAVPEPATLSLLGLGLIAGARRRRKAAAAAKN